MSKRTPCHVTAMIVAYESEKIVIRLGSFIAFIIYVLTFGSRFMLPGPDHYQANIFVRFSKYVPTFVRLRT